MTRDIESRGDILLLRAIRQARPDEVLQAILVGADVRCDEDGGPPPLAEVLTLLDIALDGGVQLQRRSRDEIVSALEQCAVHLLDAGADLDDALRRSCGLYLPATLERLGHLQEQRVEHQAMMALGQALPKSSGPTRL